MLAKKSTFGVNFQENLNFMIMDSLRSTNLSKWQRVKLNKRQLQQLMSKTWTWLWWLSLTSCRSAPANFANFLTSNPVSTALTKTGAAKVKPRQQVYLPEISWDPLRQIELSHLPQMYLQRADLYPKLRIKEQDKLPMNTYLLLINWLKPLKCSMQMIWEIGRF